MEGGFLVMAAFTMAAMLGMPIFAYQFMASFIVILRRIKADQPLESEPYWACLFFALMMWTISGTIVAAAL